MASSSGPVNWELARQVGGRERRGGRRGPRGHRRGTHGLRGSGARRRAARRAVHRPGGARPTSPRSGRCAGPSGSARTPRASRAAGAGRATHRRGDGRSPQRDAPCPPEMQAMSGMLAQLSPLLMGAQVGTVLGFLAQRVLGQYDVAVPRSGPGRVLFVVPNIAAVRERLVARSHRLPHLRGDPRGDPPVRVRPAVGARAVRASCSTTSCRRCTIDVEGMQARLATLDASRPRGAAAGCSRARRGCSAPCSTTSSGSSSGGSRRSWRRPRATATT